MPFSPMLYTMAANVNICVCELKKLDRQRENDYNSNIKINGNENSIKKLTHDILMYLNKEAILIKFVCSMAVKRNSLYFYCRSGTGIN
jgi:hypothetical protein